MISVCYYNRCVSHVQGGFCLPVSARKLHRPRCGETHLSGRREAQRRLRALRPHFSFDASKEKSSRPVEKKNALRDLCSAKVRPRVSSDAAGSDLPAFCRVRYTQCRFDTAPPQSRGLGGHRSANSEGQNVYSRALRAYPGSRREQPRSVRASMTAAAARSEAERA